MATSKRYSYTFQADLPSSTVTPSERPYPAMNNGDSEKRQSGRNSLRVTAMWSMATEMDNDVHDDLSLAQRELRELKRLISSQSKKNFLLERDVRYLDGRIGLLIHNRKALDAFDMSNLEDATNELLAKDFNPDDRRAQAYGNLFFLLQTEVSHIATLTGLVNLSEIEMLLQTVMFTLYGNQYESREEHLLLSMFQMVLASQFEATIEFGSLLRANTPVSRMMTTYTRRGPGQSYIKEVLSSRINEVLQELDMDLEINPLKVKAQLLEVASEQEAQRLNSINPDDLHRDPAISNIIEPRLQKMMDLANGFLTDIVRSVNKVPYGIRWICKQIKFLTKRKYPNATHFHITSLIGGFFMLRFVNPAIVHPQSYMLVDNSPGTNPRRTLTYVAKILQNLANKPSHYKEIYMARLQNKFIEDNLDRFNSFLFQLCEVPDFHEKLEMDQYMALSKKDMSLNISLNEIYSTHTLLLKYMDQLAPKQDDKLRIILQDLGTPPEQVPRSENRAVEINLFSRWEIPILDLASSLMNDALMTPTDILFMDTKCTMVQIIRSLPGSQVRRPLDLSQIAHAAASNGKDSSLVQRGLKAQEMLRELSDLEGSDNHEVLVEEIEHELVHLGSLRQKTKEELGSLKIVYKTICDHNSYLKSQLSSYKAYLQNVRMQSTGVKATPTKFLSSKPSSRTYTHQQLVEKGVIVKSKIPEVRQLYIFFKITTPVAGAFVISMHYRGRDNPMLEMDLKLDDLLEKQYDHVSTLDLEYVTLSVVKCIQLLNKSFGQK